MPDDPAGPRLCQGTEEPEHRLAYIPMNAGARRCNPGCRRIQCERCYPHRPLPRQINSPYRVAHGHMQCIAFDADLCGRLSVMSLGHGGGGDFSCAACVRHFNLQLRQTEGKSLGEVFLATKRSQKVSKMRFVVLLPSNRHPLKHPKKSAALVRIASRQRPR